MILKIYTAPTSSPEVDVLETYLRGDLVYYLLTKAHAVYYLLIEISWRFIMARQIRKNTENLTTAYNIFYFFINIALCIIVYNAVYSITIIAHTESFNFVLKRLKHLLKTGPFQYTQCIRQCVHIQRSLFLVFFFPPVSLTGDTVLK